MHSIFIHDYPLGLKEWIYKVECIIINKYFTQVINIIFIHNLPILGEPISGEVMTKDNICTKTGKPVIAVLLSKNLHMATPHVNILEQYNSIPKMIPLDITSTIVESVISKIHGAAGPGGVNIITLQHHILQFSGKSKELRDTVASMAAWLANDSPHGQHIAPSWAITSLPCTNVWAWDQL